MNKKLMAVAVAGALAAPAVAFAQASSIQIYGRANVGIDSYEAKGATAANSDMKRRTRIYDNGSRLGFRGSEDLGGGLKAIFVIESGVSFDNGSTTGQGGQANTSAGTLASRDSYAGLEGSWGRVTFGRQSIFWVNGVHGQTGPNYINTDIPWYNAAAFTGIARVSNVVAYNSPTFSGFNFTVSYAPGSEAAQGGAKTDAYITGVTIRKLSGPIDAQFDWGLARPASGGVNRPDLEAYKLQVGWPYGGPLQRFSVNYTSGKRDDASAVAGRNALHDNLKQKFWGINWEHAFTGSNWTVYAMYSKMDDMTGCSGAGNSCDQTDASGYTAAIRYNFSKRTWIYGSYNQVTNGRQANFDYTGGSYTSGNPLPAGADPKIWAFGVRHDF